MLALHPVCGSKKGIGALQLQRNLDLGFYQTAWHMAHRIPLAMRQERLATMLEGQVEPDETYVGGKSRETVRGWGSERKVSATACREKLGRRFATP